MTTMSSRAATSVEGRRITWVARGVYLVAIAATIIWYNDLQKVVDATWAYLTSTWIFNSVYFETWWTSLCYTLLLFNPYVFSKLNIFREYKIDQTLKWHSAGLKTILYELVVYWIPLMTLDTFIVKKYHGVSNELLVERRKDWIQYERMMPIAAPSVFQIISHIIISFIVYDAMFFVFHYSLHKNMRLYKMIHAEHHEHNELHGRVTNKLSLPERIVLVLLANESLKIVGAHPLTRTIYVVFFIGALVENHSGYDLPWTLDKVVPFNLIGGSRTHYDHHMRGSRNYQPFFTYLDRFLTRNTKSTEDKE